MDRSRRAARRTGASPTRVAAPALLALLLAALAPTGLTAAEPYSLLPPAAVERAEAEVRRGLQLADRQAVFSAREAFMRALRDIAEILDATEGGTSHSRALAAGLKALDESDEFLPAGPVGETEIDVAALAASHRTPVARLSPDEAGTSHQARSLYYTYAQSKLAEAVGNESCGSLALYALGRLHLALAPARPAIIPAAERKAVVFQQAALLADPYNPLAANELGVLLARTGRFEEARDWLRHSVAVLPDPTTWHNLAVVHERLGENQLAELASREFQSGAGPQAVLAAGRPPVRWVDPATFANGTAADVAAGEPLPAKVAVPPKTESRTGLNRWLPWK